MFAGILNPVLTPLLESVGALWFIVIISLIVSFIIVIVYKYTTDQVLMKNLKEEITALNKEAKKYMNDQKKAMGIHKQMFSKQMVMMKHSLMSSFITILPIILLVNWMNFHLAYMPIEEGQQFTVTVSFDDYIGNAELIVPEEITIVDEPVKEIAKNVDWRLSGTSGEYLLEWSVDGKTYYKDVIIAKGIAYAEPEKKINDGVVKKIDINYKPKKIIWKFNWLLSYIILALVFSSIFRKILRVY